MAARDQRRPARGRRPAHRLRPALGAEGAADRRAWRASTGPAFHTAEWRHDVDLAGKRVAVVGTGCSAIQVVPAIQPEVAQLDVYQRSPGWTLPKMDFAYSRAGAAPSSSASRVLHRLDRASVFAFQESAPAAMTRQPLAAAAVPRRRPPPDQHGDRRSRAAPQGDAERRVRLQADHADRRLVPDPDRAQRRAGRPSGSRRSRRAASATRPAVERPADAIVLATGFATPRLRRADGDRRRGGRTLAEEWGEVARAYLGLSVPGFPNMFLLYGPNTNGGSGSVVNTLECGIGHVLAALREMERARREPDRGPARGGRGLRPRAARRPRRDRLAQRLQQLVRRRERQRPEQLALDLEHLPPPHRAARARRLRAGGRAMSEQPTTRGAFTLHARERPRLPRRQLPRRPRDRAARDRGHLRQRPHRRRPAPPASRRLRPRRRLDRARRHRRRLGDLPQHPAGPQLHHDRAEAQRLRRRPARRRDRRRRRRRCTPARARS